MVAVCGIGTLAAAMTGTEAGAGWLAAGGGGAGASTTVTTCSMVGDERTPGAVARIRQRQASASVKGIEKSGELEVIVRVPRLDTISSS
jgi:hypothetical protein